MKYCEKSFSVLTHSVCLDTFLKLYKKKSFIIVPVNNILLAVVTVSLIWGLVCLYVYVCLGTSRMQFPSSWGTENNCLIYQPTETQRVKSRFSCVEITEYRVNKWPPAGKPTLKRIWRGGWGEKDRNY